MLAVLACILTRAAVSTQLQAARPISLSKLSARIDGATFFVDTRVLNHAFLYMCWQTARPVLSRDRTQKSQPCTVTEIKGEHVLSRHSRVETAAVSGCRCILVESHISIKGATVLSRHSRVDKNHKDACPNPNGQPAQVEFKASWTRAGRPSRAQNMACRGATLRVIQTLIVQIRAHRFKYRHHDSTERSNTHSP